MLMLLLEKTFQLMLLVAVGGCWLLCGVGCGWCALMLVGIQLGGSSRIRGCGGFRFVGGLALGCGSPLVGGSGLNAKLCGGIAHAGLRIQVA